MTYPKPYRPFPGQHIDFWVLDPDNNNRLYFVRQSLGMLDGLLDERPGGDVGCNAEELSAFLGLMMRELDDVMANKQHLPDFLKHSPGDNA
jgi:hypothetical protein